jgi:hypothetical protein
MGNPTNISNANSTRVQGNQDTTLNLLPIRGEKHLVQVSIYTVEDEALTSNEILQAANIAVALKPLTNYITIRVQNRGINTIGNPDPTQDAVYRFLINPSTVQINHSTLDNQSYSRGGWQFGVWGEDFVRISLSGKTAGQYFAFGLTDAYAEYTKSFRNLEMLIDTFENNGYWFEGEAAYGNTQALSFSRRPIKMHQDVILNCKEFIWYGMFDTLEVSQDADNPFLSNFTMSFVAWKERFRGDSPYYNNMPNNVQRGNSYTVYQNAMNPNSNPNITVTPPSMTGTSTSAQTQPPQPPLSSTAQSPAAASEAASSVLPTTSTTGVDYSPTPPIFNADTTYKSYWNGTLDA